MNKKFLTALVLSVAAIMSCTGAYAAKRCEDTTPDIVYITGNGYTCAKATVVNESNENKNVNFFLVRYKSDGSIGEVGFSRHNIAGNSTSGILSDDVVSAKNGDKLCAFLWSDELRPLESPGKFRSVRKEAFISEISVNGKKAVADNEACIIWVDDTLSLSDIRISDISLPEGASYTVSADGITVSSENGRTNLFYTFRKSSVKVIDFEGETGGAKPVGWSVSGNSGTSVTVDGDEENKFMSVKDMSTETGKAGAIYNLEKRFSPPYTVSYKIRYERPPFESGYADASSCWFHLRDSANNTVMSVSAKDTKKGLYFLTKSKNGDVSTTSELNTFAWHEIKMTCVSEDKAYFYLDGKLVYEAPPIVLSDIAKISIFTTDSRICTMHIDDIAIVSDSYISELEDAYALLDSQFEGVIPWLAELYDPHTGGFYTTVSGRDGTEFVPSLESTAFVYAMMNNSETGLVNSMPESFKDSLVKYFQNAQSDEDGFFYDYTVTPDEYSDRNKMRVYSQCINKLSSLGAEPLYALPAERNVQTASLMSVARINLPSGFPGYLSTVEKFMETVKQRDWDSNSWTAGDLTYEDMSYLVELGEDVYTPYINALFEWFAQRQDPVTGYWAKSGDTSFNALSGAFKVIRIYDRFSKEPPHSEKIVSSFVKTLTSGISPSSACDLRNFTDVLLILKKYDSVAVESALKGNELKIVGLISEYMKLFFKPDGGASINQDTSTSRFGGIKAGMQLAEGDIDGTQQMFIARNYLRKLFSKQLDNSMFEGQYDDFWSTIESKKLKRSVISFNGYTPGKTPVAFNSSLWTLSDDNDDYFTRVIAENSNNVVYLEDNSTTSKANGKTNNVLGMTAPFEMSFDVKYDYPDGVSKRDSVNDFSYSPFYVRNGGSTSLCGVQPIYDGGKYYFGIFENSSANTLSDFEVVPGKWYNVKMYYYRHTDGTYRTDYTFTGEDGQAKSYNAVVSANASKKATTYYFSTSDKRKCRMWIDNLIIEETDLVSRK